MTMVEESLANVALLFLLGGHERDGENRRNFVFQCVRDPRQNIRRGRTAETAPDRGDR